MFHNPQVVSFVNGTFDYFDPQGLAFQLSGFQTDVSSPTACATQSLILRSGNVTVCDNDIITAYNTLTVSAFSPAARAACVPPTLTLPAPTYCGIGSFNFTALSTYSDLSYYDGYWTHILRLCGAVSQAECVSSFGSNVQACQYHGVPGYSVNVQAALNAPTGETAFSYNRGDTTGASGVIFNITDGTGCGGYGPRKVNGVITCGTANAIQQVAESPTCTYNYVMTSPLACPLTQTFGFCAVQSSGLPATAANWYSVISGTMSGTRVTGAGSQYASVNLLNSPTYIITSLSATMQLSSLATGATQQGAANANNGSVAAANVQLNLLPVNAFGGNDNTVYYSDSNGSTPFLYTTQAGVSLSYTVGSSFYASNLYSLSSYGDNQTGLGVTAYVTYAIGSTPPAFCYPPAIALASGAVATAPVVMQFCAITYSSSVFDEYGNTAYYSSKMYGTLTATPTGIAGQYSVNRLSGYRFITNSDGFYTQSNNIQAVTLQSGVASYVYVNSTAVALNGVLGTPGLAITGGLQSDPTGCTGNMFVYSGAVVSCATGTGAYTSYTSLSNSFVVAPASAGTLPCNPVLYAAPAYTCGIGLYDFSSLKSQPDLSLIMNGYTIYMRLCGAVSQQDCVQQFGQNNMVCQWGSSTNLYEISSTNSPLGEPQFSYVNGYDGTSGITMFIQDGQQCNAGTLYPRTTTITILCGATTQLASYREGNTCQYFMTLLTPLACPPPAPLQVGSSYCGIGNYNFTLLAYANDLAVYAGGWEYFMRLCGAVRNPAIVRNLGGYTGMVVQYAPNSGVNLVAATTNPSGGSPISFAYSNGVDGTAGINYTIADGANCGSTPRQANGIITCGATNVITSISEAPACNYHIYFTTPLACNGGYGAAVPPPPSGLQIAGVPQPRTFAYCIISYSANLVPGYSVWTTALSGTVVAQQTQAGQGMWPIYQIQSATGTRSVAKADFSGAVGSTVAISGIQTPGTACFGSCNNLLYYVQAGPNATVWFDSQGITFNLASAQTDLTGCNGTAINLGYGAVTCGGNGGSTAPATTTYSVQFVPLTGPGSMNNVAPSCTPPANTLQVSVPATCGIGSFDFSSLATYGDLSVTSSGYTIYGRLCGAVTQPDCVASFGQNAQFCQWASSTSQYEMATLYAPTYESETVFSYANGANANGGILYSVKDGANCSINNAQVPRSVQGTITCATTTAFTYFAEVSTCTYVINITTPLACVPTNTFSMCYIAYSNVLSDYTGLSWSSLLSGTITTAATLPAAGTSSAVVTGFTGTRSIGSNDGLGRVLGSTAVTLGSASTCANCDNLFLWPSPASGPFDNLGLQLNLAQYQVDISGCGGTSLTLKQYGLFQCGNGGASQASNPNNQIQIYPVTAGFTPPPCVPPSVTAPAQQCGIGAYNFLPLSTLGDISGNFGGYTMYLRMCGAVTQPDCVALYGNNVQICQWAGKGSAYAEALYNSPTGETVFTYANGVDGTAGVVATIKDGQTCGSLGPRVAVVTLVCGTSNAITSYGEATTCNYAFTVTTPLACPPTQAFGFCAVTSNGPSPTYQNWLTVASGVMNGALVSVATNSTTTLDTAVNLGSAPTYLVSSIAGGTLQTSALGNGGTSNGNGVAASTSTLTLLPPGTYGGNDNWVYYLNTGAVPLLWTTSNGLSWSYTPSGSTGVTGVTGNLYSLNQYGDNAKLSGGVYATVTYALLPAGTTSYSCPAPQLTAASNGVTAVTFQFCYISYVSNIFDEFANTVYPASVTQGQMSATQTGNAGQYQVNALSGTRTYYVPDGTYTQSTATSTVSLGPGTSFVYYSSPLVANYSTTDASGLALSVASAAAVVSPDNCAGSPVYLQGPNQQCPSINTTSVYNQLVLQSGNTPAQTCAPIQYPVQTWTCGIGPYDFSSLRNLGDLNLTMNGYIIYMRLCGAVTQTDCQRQFGQNNMICQWGSSSNLYELSSNLSPFGSPQFSYANGYDGQNGISMVIADGQQCNSGRLYPRSTNITLLCGATTQLVSYSEGDACHYYLTLLTPLACPSPPPVVSSNGYCGIGAYNFTLLAYSADIVGEFPGQSIWFRLCGAVREPQCVNTFGYNSQACQFQDGGGTYSLASASVGAGQTTFSYVNPSNPAAGIAFQINNGESCGGSIGGRTLGGVITCGQYNTMLAFNEYSTCRYNVNITSPLACNGGIGAASTYSLLPSVAATTQNFGFCIQSYATNIIPGYTLWSSTLSGVLTATTSNNAIPQYTVTAATGTRIVASSDYSGKINSTATFTLAPTSSCVGGCDNIIYYNPTVGSTAYVDGTGIALALSASQTEITGCSGGQISLINYNTISCSASGLSTATYSFSLVPQTGTAAPSCPQPPASTPALSLQPQPTCGIGSVSFTSLAQQDLSIAASGYVIYGRLCGAVTQPDCVRTFGNNAQFCQWASAGSQYEMAALQATAGETTFGYVNGVNGNAGYTYFVRDGATCNINNVVFPRSVQGNITCGASNNFTTFYEQSAVTGNSSLACHYVVNIQSPAACLNGAPTSTPGGGGASSSTAINGGGGATSTNTNTGGTQQSTGGGVINSGGGGSSLSGGAIAGIVIGSVVGASILLVLMLAICCGLGARGGKATTNSAQKEGAAQSGKYAPQEESQVQSEVAHEHGEDEVEMTNA